MGVDMLENNELGVFQPSRVGSMRQFVNDGRKGASRRTNRVGNTNDEFANLFGSKKRKQSLAQRREEVKQRYANLDLDCSGIDASLGILQADLEGLQSRLLSVKPSSSDADFINAEIQQVQTEIARVKSAYSRNGCEEAKKAARVAQSTQQIGTLAAQAVEATKKDLQALGILSDSTKAPAGTTTLADGTVVDSVTGAPVTAGGIDKKKLFLYGGIGLGVLAAAFLILRKR